MLLAKFKQTYSSIRKFKVDILSQHLYKPSQFLFVKRKRTHNLETVELNIFM
jgi:hypothetical protein